MIKTVLRLGLGGLAIVAVVAAGLALIIGNRLYASLPQTTGTLDMPGLQDETLIIRDSHGVPHIFAERDRDAFYALGVAHAQDRLWQMEITRRALRGRLAEILGADALSSDRQFRALGLGPAADTAYANLRPEVQAALGAYAAGINAVIEAPGFVPPPEFQILMYTPEPWRPSDTVVTYKAIALDLFGNAFEETRVAELRAHLGDQRATEFLGRYPDDAPRALSAADMNLPTDLAPTGSTSDSPSIGPDDTGRDGSNNWVLGGSRTQSGHPILANDPHLGLRAPAIWYLARLTTPDGSVVGATLPGTPFVTLGRNDNIAWGFTNTGPDVGDLRAVTEADIVSETEETIAVRFGEDVTLTRRMTRHGPVLDEDLFNARIEGAELVALQWMLDESDDGTTGVGLDIIRAQGWDDFVGALRDFVAPMQSMVFASRDGDIGLYAPGRIPVRDENGDWTATLPFDALPHARNPRQGFIATANNKIVPDEYPHFITAEWYGVARIRRIYEGIEARSRHNLDSMAELQVDSVSNMAQRLLPVLLTARPATEAGETALARLANWDGDMATEHPEPLIYAAWMRELARAVYADELGPLFNTWYADRRLFMSDVLEGAASAWCDDTTTPATELCVDLFGPALDRAMQITMEAQGDDIGAWRWGDVHYAVHEHTPFSQFPVLGDWFTIETPVPGDGSTVNVAHFSYRTPGYEAVHGASYRALYDLGQPDASRFMITTGQSGNVLSRHYDDLAPLWGRGEYIEIPSGWMPDTAPEDARVLRLQPGPPNAER
ncbi:penicillin acylase family protein [Maricaulis sp. CAU 1757]